MKPLDRNIPALAVHVVCIAVIVACFALAQYVTIPGAKEVLIGAGFWLWGKLGFKPAGPIVDGILQQLGPTEAARIASMQPPPHSAGEESSE